VSLPRPLIHHIHIGGVEVDTHPFADYLRRTLRGSSLEGSQHHLVTHWGVPTLPAWSGGVGTHIGSFLLHRQQVQHGFRARPTPQTLDDLYREVQGRVAEALAANPNERLPLPTKMTVLRRGRAAGYVSVLHRPPNRPRRTNRAQP